MPDVVLSYARSTEASAKRLAEILRGLNYDVWFDEQLPAHRAYSDVIEERLRAAKAVVVLWSFDAVKSHWVRAEADLARNAGTLVQISLDGALPPLPFNQIHCVSFAGWRGDADDAPMAKLLQSVGELAPPGAAPAANPAEPRGRAPLLAVLAFDNLSADAEMAYFSDGVSEDILQTVARTCDIAVIARASSFQFRGADKTVKRIVADLGVTHLLDGSVQKSGSRVRISAQLMDCASQTTLWSGRFDRELSDVFALQDEIAGEVANATNVAFAPYRRGGGVDPAAYDLYLRSRNLIVERDPAPCIALLERAVEIAPDFAAAWSALCWARAAQARRGPRPTSFEVLKAGAVQAAERALELDPHAGLAYAALSNLEPIANYAERERLLQRALDVAPNDPETLTVFAAFCSHVGFTGRALGFAARAYELDPLYPRGADVYSTVLHNAGRVAEAEDLVEACRHRWPERSDFLLGLINSTAFSHNWPKFERVAAEARAGQLTPNQKASIRLGEALRDGPQEMAPRARELLQHTLAEHGTLPLPLLLTSMALGLKEEVFAAIETADYGLLFDEDGPDPSGPYSPSVIFDVAYNGEMIGDRRFVRLCAKMGLCDYWVAVDRWPDCAERVRGDYDFEAEVRLCLERRPAPEGREMVPPG